MAVCVVDDAGLLLLMTVCSVQKNAATGKVEVTSTVYTVSEVEGENWQLFPSTSSQNFCYVFVDVLRRQCTVWYHAQDATSSW
mmetsp:Transcript_31967/g.61507  ORF Transcript_31967/g.61507 Transcript_31967/m.61507 type:complete len:83 (-) Transcript_31967:565-813(-)